MKAPLSWIREYAALPDDLTADDLATWMQALVGGYVPRNP